jgi:hypothetical protein
MREKLLKSVQSLVPDVLVGVTNATDVVAVAAIATAVSDCLAAFDA